MQKAKKLKAFVKFLVSEYNGKLRGFFKEEKDTLRKKLLAIHGIGNETADSIMLYAAEKPVFVVDAYTIRIGNRIGLFRFSDYDQAQKFFESNLPKDLEMFKEFHALIVELGKNYCKKKPSCVGCPIRSTCEMLLKIVK
jgi:endonuclease-3 related protein